MTDRAGPNDPLATAEALQALTHQLVTALPDEEADLTPVLERRAELLAVPVDASALDEEARDRARTIGVRVEALEETALELLSQRVAEIQAALAALDLGWTATHSYLEHPALPPLLVDRRD
ncbi:MAG: hypothetical protein ACE5JD_14040 [Candidatus Methylomirabilia bacterium]